MSYGSIPHVLFSDVSNIPSTDRTSNPKPVDSWSMFGHESCGEPLFPQHVAIDFTPNDDDTDLVQRKVCAFWQFINSHPEIQNLKVKPMKTFYEDSATGIVTASNKSSAKAHIHVKDTKQTDEDIIDVLKFAEEKKLIDTSLVPMVQSKCAVVAREYNRKQIKPQLKKQEMKHVCKCIPCRNPNCRNKRASSISRDVHTPTNELRKSMNEWDAQHPQSMEPPGHSPPLQHCITQKQMFPESS